MSSRRLVKTVLILEGVSPACFIEWVDGYETRVEYHNHSVTVDKKVVTQSKTIIRCKK